jgi:NADP-dependent 3-hydroxy acid dehydrogenase YdfG
VILNNADVMPHSPLERRKIEDWDRTIAVQYAIPADSFACAVVFAISQPENVDINEILFRPTRQEL